MVKEVGVLAKPYNRLNNFLRSLLSCEGRVDLKLFYLTLAVSCCCSLQVIFLFKIFDEYHLSSEGLDGNRMMAIFRWFATSATSYVYVLASQCETSAAIWSAGGVPCVTNYKP